MSIRSILEEPREAAKFGYPYAMLLFILLLLAEAIRLLARSGPERPFSSYLPAIVVIMLLLNHLAYSFEWPRFVGISLRVASFIWMAFGASCVLYVSV